MTEMTEQSQTIKINFCECCKYQAKTKFNFNKHLATKKHIKNSNTEPLTGPICVELKIKKEKKLKPVMVEMETQTDACDEEQCVDVIELENKNMILEEENNELRNELKEKCEEFEAENTRLLKIIAELNAKNNQEIVDEMKRDIDGYLFDIKEKDEEIEELKKQLEEKNENLEQSIRLVIEPKVELEKIETEFIDETNEEISVITEYSNHIECKTEIIDEPIVEIKKMKIPQKKSKRELEMEKKIRELENVNKNLKSENIELQVSSYTNNSPNGKKKNNKNNRNNDDIITKNEIRDMCDDVNINTCIKNYCEKNYNNEIITHKVLKYVDTVSYSKNSDKLYYRIFNNIMDNIPDERKPFVCVDVKRKIFNYYDETSKKWKLTNNNTNKDEFEKYLKYIFSYINKSLIQSLLNTKELSNKVFKEVYDRDKKLIFGDSDEHNLIGKFTMLLYCNLFDTADTESVKIAEAFMKHALVLCSGIRIEKKKSKNNKKSRRYESESDETEEEETEEDEYEYDD